MLNQLSYFLTKTYFVGTQKNQLNEMVSFSTQNIYLDLMLKIFSGRINSNVIIGTQLKRRPLQEVRTVRVKSQILVVR